LYQVGVIGCGGISRMHHSGFTETGKARVSRVYDANARSAAERAKEWGAAAMPSVEELISSVDIVVVATPGFAHREYVEAAAAAGRHIVCEKPVALDLEDALAMEEAVRSGGGKFMVSFNHRYTPALCTLRDVAASGEIGGVVSAWVRWHAPAPSERWRQIEASGHWRASMELSGGRINEFCSHAIDWLLWVLDTPESVYGKALRVTEGFTLDDADYALVNCRGGVGSLDVSRHAGVAPESNYGVMGHGGSVVLKDGKILLTLMDEETEELPPLTDLPEKHEHFLRCIENDEQPLTGIEDAIDTLRVCLAFNRSAESGRVEPA
jgi:predicted dehydrogenase